MANEVFTEPWLPAGFSLNPSLSNLSGHLDSESPVETVLSTLLLGCLVFRKETTRHRIPEA